MSYGNLSMVQLLKMTSLQTESQTDLPKKIVSKRKKNDHFFLIRIEITRRPESLFFFLFPFHFHRKGSPGFFPSPCGALFCLASLLSFSLSLRLFDFFHFSPSMSFYQRIMRESVFSILCVCVFTLHTHTDDVRLLLFSRWFSFDFCWGCLEFPRKWAVSQST